MPYADRAAQKAAQRAWYEREREKAARGETKPAPPPDVPVAEDLRGAHRIVGRIRANARADRQRARQWREVQKMPFMSRAREDEQRKLDGMSGAPHADAPTLLLSAPELERRVLLIVAGLVRGAETLGWSVAQWSEPEPPVGLPLLIDGEVVMVQWSEPRRQVKVEVDRTFRIGRQTHRTVLEPSGRIEFGVGSYRVRDTKRWMIEDRLGRMLRLAEQSLMDRREAAWDRAERAQKAVETELIVARMKQVAAERRAAELRVTELHTQVLDLARASQNAEILLDFAERLVDSYDPLAPRWRVTALEAAAQLDPLAPGARLPAHS